MHIWRHQLKLALPGDRDGVLVSCAGLVVEDLKINPKTSGSQSGHDGIVCFDAVLVTPGFEGLLKDEVAIGVVGNHDILVSRPCFDGETTGIIGVELADGQDADEEFVGRGFWGSGRRRRWQGSGALGLGRPDVLAPLGKMTHYGLVRVGAIPCSIRVGKTVKGLKVAGLDGLQPSLLDWKAHECVVKPYKRGNAG
jgi:hypothetical protein